MFELNIKQDSKELNSMFRNMSPENFRKFGEFFLETLSNDVKRIWMQEVLNSGAKKGWKEIYASSIKIDYSKKNELMSEIYTDAREAYWIEKGIKRFDMKENDGPKGGLLGKGAKTNKKGELYRRIFMKRGNPNAQHVGINMPNVIYTKVKQLPFGKGLTGTKSLKVNTSSEAGKRMQKSLSAGHFEGIQKSKKGGYGVFRVVKKSSPGWFYPGSSAVEIFPRVKTMIPGRVNQVAMSTLEAGLKRMARG